MQTSSGFLAFAPCGTNSSLLSAAGKKLTRVPWNKPPGCGGTWDPFNAPWAGMNKSAPPPSGIKLPNFLRPLYHRIVPILRLGWATALPVEPEARPVPEVRMLLAGGIAPGIGGGGVDREALDKPATSPKTAAAGALSSGCKFSGLIALTSPSGSLTSQRPTDGSNLMSKPRCPLRLAAACRSLRTTVSPGCKPGCMLGGLALAP
mmetsp:Transcript_18715/g.33855  ORF Transcript_18715/g.33855 Transcript_18715/m.33855 type:complete len:205 (-) Transcript_18715:529-1143(-)